MTEDRPEPDPSDPDRPHAGGPDDDDHHRWVRRHLDPVVDRPVPDAWAAIRAQVASGALPVPLAAGRRRRTRAVRAVAAAALVVAVAGGAFAVIRTAGHGRSVAGGPAPEAGPTGFVAPTDLPPGWRVTSFDIDTTTMACPCRVGRWRRSDGAWIVAFTHPDENHTSSTPNVQTDAVSVSATWADGDGTLRAVRAGGLDRDEVLALAAGWSGDRTLPVAAGFTMDVDRVVSAREVRTASVQWRVAGPNGAEVIASLVPLPGGVGGFDPAPVGPAAALPATGYELRVVPDWSPALLTGVWPGGAGFSMADATGPGPDTAHAATSADQLAAVANGFRPLTAPAWSSYVHRTYPVDPRKRPITDRAVVATATIEGWNTARGTTPPTVAPDPPVDVTPVPPSDPWPMPRVRQGRGGPGDQSHLLTVTIDPEDVTDTSGNATLTFTVAATNDTAGPLTVGSCLLPNVQWMLHSRGEEVRFGGSRVADCTLAPQTVAPGQALTTTLDLRLADDGEPLAPGRYEAVFDFAEFDGPIHVPVTVR